MGQESGYVLPIYADATAMRDLGAPVFLYLFDYEREPGIGLSHAQDMNYLFGFNFYDHWGNDTDANDTLIAEIYSQYFVSFAKTGEPTAGMEWKPLASPFGDNYYSITLEPTSQPHFYTEPIRFWTQTAPAIIEGAEYEAKAQGLPSPIDATPIVNLANIPINTILLDETVQTETPSTSAAIDYKTAFWILLAVLIVVLVTVVIIAIVRYCQRGESKNKVANNPNAPTENTPLVAKKKNRLEQGEPQPIVHQSPLAAAVKDQAENSQQQQQPNESQRHQQNN
jgi:hypothetical protein